MESLQIGDFVISHSTDEQLELVLVEQGEKVVRHQRVETLQKLKINFFIFNIFVYRHSWIVPNPFLTA